MPCNFNHWWLRPAVCAWLLLGGNTTTLHAEPTIGKVPTISLEDQVLLDVADGKLDSYELFTAAIVLSGESQTKLLEDFQHQMARCNDCIDQRLSSSMTDQEIARTILVYLHRQLLTGDYQPGCCDLRSTLTDGSHNCIMSTILFQSLAQQAGLKIRAVALPEHVRCELLLPGGEAVAIETTSAIGIGSHGGSPRNAPTPRGLSDVQLLAKLLYNRGLDGFERRDFASALRMTELSCQLDPDHHAAAENAVAVVNNWALQLCKTKEFEAALRLLESGTSINEDSDLLKWNQAHVISRWIQNARQAGDAKTVSRLTKRTAAHSP